LRKPFNGFRLQDTSVNGIHYRILYFFHGNIAAVAAHGITKESAVPPLEIERAIARRRKFESNPVKHTYTKGLA
jgi:hypothetical protein